MSRPMTLPAVEMTKAPTRKTGTINNMPAWMLNESDTAPTMGNMMRPGMTKMAPIEKPSDRARAGMASDSEAKTPGPTMARLAEMAMLATIPTHR